MASSERARRRQPNQYPDCTIAGLTTRLYSKFLIPRFPNSAPDFEACWGWKGGQSRSGFRKVSYPCLWVGARATGRNWRVARLILIFKHLGEFPELAQKPGETVQGWLGRANATFRHLDASHVVCDNSGCVNGFHLAWETHLDNVANQRRRQEARAYVETPPATL